MKDLPGGVPLGSLATMVTRLARALRPMSGEGREPRRPASAGRRVALPAAWEMVAVAALIVVLSLAGFVLVRLETSTLAPTPEVAAPAGGRPTPCGAAASTTRNVRGAPPTIGARFAC